MSLTLRRDLTVIWYCYHCGARVLGTYPGTLNEPNKALTNEIAELKQKITDQENTIAKKKPLIKLGDTINVEDAPCGLVLMSYGAVIHLSNLKHERSRLGLAGGIVTFYPLQDRCRPIVLPPLTYEEE